MTIGAIPVSVIFVGTIVLMMASTEVGYRFGCLVHRRSSDGTESSSSVVTQSVLALGAFMLAFTFGIVANRFETRKQLVRQEFNAIGTAWLRTDFLPEHDRGESREILGEYVAARVELYQSRFTKNDLPTDFLSAAERSHCRLWEIGVAYAQKNVNSHVAGLYLESLNQVFDIHALRLAHGPSTRTPTGIWLALIGLVALGMTAAGYQTSIAGSKRPKSRPILAVSFALVITLVADLDRPGGGFIGVSHQPLINLQSSMTEGPATAE
jgi:hypothetical protein